MTIVINGVAYNGASWKDRGFSMITDMTMAEAETAFTPGSDYVISIFDGESEVERYYNKGLVSLKVTNSSPRIMTVEFNLSKIDPTAEEAIRDDMETSDGAIAELAEIIASLEETIDDLNSRVEALENGTEVIVEPEEATEEEEEQADD